MTSHLRSNTCLSTAIYRSWFSVQARRREQRFPCAAFSKPPQHAGIPCGNAGFLISSGVRCGGACAATKSSRKPWMRYGLTRIILQPPRYGLKCSSKALSGGTTRAAARQGLLPRRRGPRARNQAHPPRLDRCEFVLRRGCKPRRRLTSRTRLGRRPPRAARQEQPAPRVRKGVQADPRPFLIRSVNAAACQIHVFQKFKLIQVIFPLSFCKSHAVTTHERIGRLRRDRRG